MATFPFDRFSPQTLVSSRPQKTHTETELPAETHNSITTFGRSMKTHLFSTYQHVQRISGVSRNALHKCTILTYLLTYLSKVVQMLVLIGLYILKCTKFDQLILRKIIKIVATRCQILWLKCTKINFGWGSRPHWRSLECSPRPPS